MGISDDIRPKKEKKSKIEEPKEEIEEENTEEDGELVSIKHGADHDFVEADIEEQRIQEEQEKSEHDEMKNYFYTDQNGKDYTETKKIRGKGNMGKWLIILLILALVLIILWQNLDSIKSFLGIKTEESSSSDDSEPYSDFSVNDGSASSADPTADTSAATDTSAASAAANTSAKLSYSISVLNGNGVKGSAAGVTSSIIAAGYSVAHTGNALKFSYTDTLIYYKTGKSAAATDLKTVLSDRECELLEENTITGQYDIVIVVGKT